MKRVILAVVAFALLPLAVFAVPSFAARDKDTPKCATFAEWRALEVDSQTTAFLGWHKARARNTFGNFNPALSGTPDYDGYFYRQSCSGDYAFELFYFRPHPRNTLPDKDHPWHLNVKCAESPNFSNGTRCVGRF